MATAETLTVHPGDIIQDTEGMLYLATETHRWGVGAIARWKQGGEDREAYYRFRPGQFVVCGPAHLLPPEVSAARRDSLAGAREIAKESGK